MKWKVAFRAFFYAFKHPLELANFLDRKEPKKVEAAPLEYTHLRLLSLLQGSSRLVDFLKEEISSFSDAEVGAAVRQIHADSAKTLEEIVTIRPTLDETEGSNFTVPAGYDPAVIKVTGKVKGEPPFKGKIRHRGWKAHKLSLPKQLGEYNREIIWPAEVEIE